VFPTNAQSKLSSHKISPGSCSRRLVGSWGSVTKFRLGTVLSWSGVVRHMLRSLGPLRRQIRAQGRRETNRGPTICRRGRVGSDTGLRPELSRSIWSLKAGRGHRRPSLQNSSHLFAGWATPLPKSTPQVCDSIAPTAGYYPLNTRKVAHCRILASFLFSILNGCQSLFLHGNFSC